MSSKGLRAAMRGMAGLVLMASLTGHAAGKTVVIGAGQCEKADLINDVRGLTDQLKKQTKGVIEESEFRELVGAPPTASPEEVKAQFAAAQHSFYFGHIASARRQFEAALSNARRLPPGDAQWAVVAPILAFRGLFFLGQGNKDAPAAQQSFTELLRLEPGYKFDQEVFAPGTLKFANHIRSELRDADKLALDVVSQPSGANIYIDGKLQGRTPAKLRLPAAGQYPIVLMKDGVRSFPHLVDVQSEAKLSVDLALEGSIPAERFPCMNARPGTGDLRSSALKLAELLGAEQVVLLSLAPGGNWLRASVFDKEKGQKIREGAIKVALGEKNPEGLADLASFVLGGEAPNVVLDTPPAPAPTPVAQAPASKSPIVAQKPAPISAPPAREPTRAPDLAPAPAPAPETAATAPVTASPPTRQSLVGRDIASWSLVGLAVVSAGVGIGLQVAANSQAGQFNDAYSGVGPSANQLPQLASLRDSSRGLNTGAWVLGGVAVASAAGAITLFATRPHVATNSSVGPVISASVGLGSALLTVRTP